MVFGWPKKQKKPGDPENSLVPSAESIENLGHFPKYNTKAEQNVEIIP